MLNSVGIEPTTLSTKNLRSTEWTKNSKYLRSSLLVIFDYSNYVTKISKFSKIFSLKYFVAEAAGFEPADPFGSSR